MRIDSHQHFWNYDATQYAWIDDQKSALRRNFTPADLAAETAAAGIGGVVSVQARQTIDETRWLLQLAEQNEFIRGVVGWVPLVDPCVEALLEELASFGALRSIRHVLQDEPDEYPLGSEFNRGVGQLKRFGLVYDLLVFGRQLPAALQFVDRHPEQPMVLDHIAKPVIRRGSFDEPWARHFRELAKRPRIDCKFSGVVTEVGADAWDLELIRPYWDVALEAFGPRRLMFGSDWPVCRLKTTYAEWAQTVEVLAGSLSASEQAYLFGRTAARAYGLMTP